jgi:hypothetical protein
MNRLGLLHPRLLGRTLVRVLVRVVVHFGCALLHNSWESHVIRVSLCKQTTKMVSALTFKYYCVNTVSYLSWGKQENAPHTWPTPFADHTTNTQINLPRRRHY